MRLFERLKEFRSNPKKRTQALFVVMISLLITAIYLFISTFQGATKYESFLMCIKCKHQEFKEITDLSDVCCSKCGKPEGLAYKCDVCQYEFAYLPTDPKHLPKMTIEKYRQFRLDEARCPNCQSTFTHEMNRK